MTIPSKRLDEILASFDQPAGAATNEKNPADAEFDRPSNFPTTVELAPIVSEFRDLIPNPDASADYDHIRTVLRHLVDRGINTLEGAINIAKETENARSIEVVSQMMRTITDVTDKLMELHKTTAGMGTPVQPGSNQVPGQTNVYILDKGKSAKDILNGLLKDAINGTAVEVKDDNGG